MSAKPVIPSILADRDIREAIDYYVEEAGVSVALEFIEKLEDTMNLIADYPAAGSSRYDHELGLPDLKCRLLKRFPYLVFYIEKPDRIDVWRVLHGQRDVPAWLRDGQES